MLEDGRKSARQSWGRHHAAGGIFQYHRSNRYVASLVQGAGVTRSFALFLQSRGRQCTDLPLFPAGSSFSSTDSTSGGKDGGMAGSSWVIFIALVWNNKQKRMELSATLMLDRDGKRKDTRIYILLRCTACWECVGAWRKMRSTPFLTFRARELLTNKTRFCSINLPVR